MLLAKRTKINQMSKEDMGRKYETTTTICLYLTGRKGLYNEAGTSHQLFKYG
jgi:hypothetical protein